MRRVLLWLIGCVALWGVLVYLLSRPRTWTTLALFSERVSYGARAAYNVTKQRQAECQNNRTVHTENAVKRATDPLPSADDVIDAIRHILRGRGRGP